MTTKNPVLPNFLKTVLFAAAASMSLSTFAGDYKKGEAEVGDLKDRTSEGKEKLDAAQDELKAMLAAEEDAAAEQAEADTLMDSLDSTQDALTAPEAE